MADRDGLGQNREPFHRSMPPLGEDVVEQDGVDASDQQVAVRVHVIVVRHRAEAVLALRAQQDFVRDRSAERADGLAPQIREGSNSSGVGVAHAEHFSELVIRDRHRERGASGGRVFDAAHADVRVAAGDALIDGLVLDVQKLRRAAETAGEQIGNLDIEADDAIGARRVGFDEGRAPLGVARPAQHARRFGGVK